MMAMMICMLQERNLYLGMQDVGYRAQIGCTVWENDWEVEKCREHISMDERVWTRFAIRDRRRAGKSDKRD